MARHEALVTVYLQLAVGIVDILRSPASSREKLILFKNGFKDQEHSLETIQLRTPLSQ